MNITCYSLNIIRRMFIEKKKMLILGIVLLTIGFASVTTTLIINGVASIASNTEDFNIIFTSAKLNNVNRNDFIDETKKNINFETNDLTKMNDEAVLNYEVTNTSRQYDGEVVISCEINNSEYVNVSYTPKNMIVEAGTTKSGSITARLLKASEEDQNIVIICTIDAKAVKERI